MSASCTVEGQVGTQRPLECHWEAGRYQGTARVALENLALGRSGPSLTQTAEELSVFICRGLALNNVFRATLLSVTVVQCLPFLSAYTSLYRQCLHSATPPSLISFVMQHFLRIPSCRVLPMPSCHSNVVQSSYHTRFFLRCPKFFLVSPLSVTPFLFLVSQSRYLRFSHHSLSITPPRPD